MASIEKRGPCVWRVGVRTSVEEGRKWIRKTITFPEDMPEEEQRARANLAGAQLELDYAQGRISLTKRTTVSQLAELWMERHIRPNCKATTIKTYQSFLSTRILPQLGDLSLSQLTPLRLAGFFADLRTDRARSTAIEPSARVRSTDRSKPLSDPRTLSDRTVRHYYDCLRDMLNVAVKWELMSENPLDRVDPPRVKKKRPVILDDRQAVQLLRCLALEDSLSLRCAVLLALLCGLRLSEVCALTLDDVDFEQCTISITRGLNYAPELGNYIDTPKSDAGTRVIDLPAGMMALLDANRAYQLEAAHVLGDIWRGDGHIVFGWDGAPLHHDTPSKQFRRFADKNGFQGVRFHDLRHTHATLLFASNIDAVAVASRLGHEDASTTLRIYAHAIRRRDLESAQAMQRLFESANVSFPVPHIEITGPDDSLPE